MVLYSNVLIFDEYIRAGNYTYFKIIGNSSFLTMLNSTSSESDTNTYNPDIIAIPS